MGPQLSAFFATHRTAILGGGAAAVAGLALMRRKSAAGGSVPAGAASVPATIPAAAIAPSGSAYDSSGFDAYNGLQQEIGQLANNTEALRQTVGAPAAAAPKPVASSLYAPNYTGKYVWTPDGTVAEIESDGSLFGLTHSQFWANPDATTAERSIVDLRKGSPLQTYTTASNVAAANPTHTPA